MNISSVSFSTIQHANKKAQAAPQLSFMQKADQLSLSNKIENKHTISFKGLFGPPKVNEKNLNQLVRIIDSDPIFQEVCRVENSSLVYPYMEMVKEGDAIKVDLGYKVNSKIYKQVEASVNTKTAVITYKAVDGEKHKEGPVKRAIDGLFRQVLRALKG